MKYLIIFFIFVCSNFAWSQGRTGSGPDELGEMNYHERDIENHALISDLVGAVNRNLKKCPGQENVQFKNILELYTHYNLKDILKVENMCVHDSLHVDIQCAFEGDPIKHLHSLINKNEGGIRLSTVLAEHGIKDKHANHAFKEFFLQIDKKLTRDKQFHGQP